MNSQDGTKNDRTGCIYCFSTTLPKGVEHVVSKAIGIFKQNWTLDCVCDECNGDFSETLDLTLGRDSAEGVLRVMAGVKPAETIEDFRNRTVAFRWNSQVRCMARCCGCAQTVLTSFQRQRPRWPFAATTAIGRMYSNVTLRQSLLAGSQVQRSKSRYLALMPTVTLSG